MGPWTLSYHILKQLIERYDPNEWLWLISYSGGKDSTLLLFSVLELSKELGFNFAVVYNDSGGDLPELRSLAYKVLDYVRSLDHKVYVTKPQMSFFDYLLTKYSPPRWNFRWCCKRLKELPFKKLVEDLSKSHRVLNLVGNRRKEARWRNWDVKAISESLIYIAPLLDLEAHDVWSALEHLSSLNSFYKSVTSELKSIYGEADRSGCWFCPLVMRDKLLESKPELLRLKYEVLSAWCEGRREKIVELSKLYPDLINVTVTNVSTSYPCRKTCSSCQVLIVKEYLKVFSALR